MSDAKGGGYMKTAFFIVANILTNVSIVMVNKSVFETYGFHYPTALTAVHFAVTGLGLHLAASFGVFERKPVPWGAIMPLSLSYALCTPLSNLSLHYNSVGFYQLAKLAFIPYLMGVQTAFYGATFSDGVKSSVVPLTAGIAIATAGEAEVSVSLPGLACAVGAIVATARYQIQVGSLTKDLGLNNLQLVLNMMPGATIIVMCLAPIVDGIGMGAVAAQAPLAPEDAMADGGTGAFAAVMFSAVLAFGVNVTTFLLIGHTSPLTYNIVGFLKTLLVLIFGVVFFNTPTTPKNQLGTVVALSGLALYMWLKLREREDPASQNDRRFTVFWYVCQAAMVFFSIVGVFLLSTTPACPKVGGEF